MRLRSVSLADRRRCRPDTFHQDTADLRRSRRFPAGQSPRPQPAFRRPRARDGCGTEWHGTGQAASVRFGLPDLLRLHAQSDPAISDHAVAGAVRLRTTGSASARTDQPTSRLNSLPGCAPCRGSLCCGPATPMRWRRAGVSLQLKHQPACLILSRQPLPTLDRSRFASAARVARGALCPGRPRRCAAPEGDPDRHGQRGFSLHLRRRRACGGGYPDARRRRPHLRELFEQQDEAYQEQVLPEAIAARVAVEQAAALGWARYVGRRGAVVGMHTFGASAPLKGLLAELGFTRGPRRDDRPDKSPRRDLGDPALQLALGILSRGGSGSKTTPRTFPTGGGLLMDETGVPGPTGPRDWACLTANSLRSAANSDNGALLAATQLRYTWS